MGPVLSVQRHQECFVVVLSNLRRVPYCAYRLHCVNPVMYLVQTNIGWLCPAKRANLNAKKLVNSPTTVGGIRQKKQ